MDGSHVEDVDLLVVGGGKAGKSLAMDRAKAGWKVAMVERDKIGGTCINMACIPTKALVGSARTLVAARRAARAKTLHDTIGTWKVVVDAGSDRILGPALLGHNAGEVIAALQMAMLGGLRYQQVRDAVLTHPTMTEGLNLLFDALDDDTSQRRATERAADAIPSG